MAGMKIPAIFICEAMLSINIRLRRSNFQTAKLLFLGRMAGRRTGAHFAWPCSAILAAGFPRECQIFFSICSLNKRERSAVWRICLQWRLLA